MDKLQGGGADAAAEKHSAYVTGKLSKVEGSFILNIAGHSLQYSKVGASEGKRKVLAIVASL